MRILPHSCRRYKHRISLLAAGSLAESERSELEEHAAHCPGCREALADTVAMVRELSQTCLDRAHLEPSSTFHARWVRAVQDANRGGVQPAEATLTRLQSRLSLLILPRPAAWAALGAVWVLILCFSLSSPQAPSRVARVQPPARSIPAYLEQRHELARLLDAPPPRVAPAPVPIQRPRTQRQTSTLLG